MTVRAHCDYTFIVLVGNDSVFEMRDVIHRYLKEHEIKLKGLERNSCIGAINDRRSLEFDSEDWWTERLSAKTTGASDSVVTLSNDGSAVTIDQLLTAAFGGNKPFRNVEWAFGITHFGEERGCFRALRNNFQKGMGRCDFLHSPLSNGGNQKRFVHLF